MVMRNNDYKPLSSSTSPFSASPSCASPSSSPASPSTIEHNSISRGDSATSAAMPEEKVWEEVNVTSDQAKHIETITRAQADSVEWHYERSIRITASFFGRVCRRLPTTTSDTLVNSIVNLKNYQSMPVACAWGKNNESKARNAYFENMKMTGHSNLEVFESGLVVNIKYSFLGASPDGVIHDPVSADPDGLLEIKCPGQRDISPYEAARQKSSFVYYKDGNLHLKKNNIIIITRCKGKWQ